MKRKPLPRDLTKAITLRPREVFELYGLTPCTVSRIVNSKDPAVFLPSSLVPGRRGHKGVRLIDHAELRAYLERRKTRLLANPVVSAADEAARRSAIETLPGLTA